MTLPAAHTMQCRYCGALVAVHQVVAMVVCAHCGRREPLGQELAARMWQYQHRVAHNLQTAHRYHAEAAAYQSTAARMRKSSSGLGFALIVGLPLPLALVLSLAMHLGYVDHHQGTLISYALIGALVVGVVFYAVSASVGGRSRAPRVAAGASTVACPNCGAVGQLEHGQALDRCGYCGAALMPSATLVQTGVDAASHQLRQAQLQRLRSERALIASVQGVAASGSTVLFMSAGMLSLLTGIPAVGFIVAMVRGEEPYNSGIAVLVGLCMASLVVLFGGLGWLRRRKRTMVNACGALAQQLGGCAFSSLRVTVSWLNDYWAAPYESRYLSAAGLYGGAHGGIDGYAVLAECFASRGRYCVPRVHILLAALVPGRFDGSIATEGPPAAEQERLWLRERGYQLKLTSTGILLQADARRVKEMRRHLGAFGQLGPVLAHAARYARAIGAKPVGRNAP